MKRKIFSILFIIGLTVLSFNFVYFYALKTETEVFAKTAIKNRKKYYNDIVLEIPDINLLIKVQKSDENFNNLKNNVVYYNDFDPLKTNVMLGHSGTGKGTYFNKIDDLKKGGLINVYYKDSVINYVVKKVYLISKNDYFILENDDKIANLKLITCLKGNNNKRLVVESMIKQ
ncbi:MAG: sortase [Bacilli bacterium]